MLSVNRTGFPSDLLSPSSRRAWVEISPAATSSWRTSVALLAEGVGRNQPGHISPHLLAWSPSSRRAWIKKDSWHRRGSARRAKSALRTGTNAYLCDNLFCIRPDFYQAHKIHSLIQSRAEQDFFLKLLRYDYSGFVPVIALCFPCKYSQCRPRALP